MRVIRIVGIVAHRTGSTAIEKLLSSEAVQPYCTHCANISHIARIGRENGRHKQTDWGPAATGCSRGQVGDSWTSRQRSVVERRMGGRQRGSGGGPYRIPRGPADPIHQYQREADLHTPISATCTCAYLRLVDGEEGREEAAVAGCVVQWRS